MTLHQMAVLADKRMDENKTRYYQARGIDRRKSGDEYRQVMMEMIPANDYSEESQSLFLYVKDIDQ